MNGKSLLEIMGSALAYTKAEMGLVGKSVCLQISMQARKFVEASYRLLTAIQRQTKQ
jgi:hypothetical protein